MSTERSGTLGYTWLGGTALPQGNAHCWWVFSAESSESSFAGEEEVRERPGGSWASGTPFNLKGAQELPSEAGEGGQEEPRQHVEPPGRQLSELSRGEGSVGLIDREGAGKTPIARKSRAERGEWCAELLLLFVCNTQ